MDGQAPMTTETRDVAAIDAEKILLAWHGLRSGQVGCPGCLAVMEWQRTGVPAWTAHVYPEHSPDGGSDPGIAPARRERPSV